MTLPQHEDVVRPEWIDSNGHMNLAYYIVVFDHATDLVFDFLDIGAAYRYQTGNSCFVVETHTLYQHEVVEHEQLRVTTRLLGIDDKRLHVFHEMYRFGADERVAAHEIMCVNIDMRTRRTAPFPPDRRATLAAAVREEAKLALPSGVGRRIAMPG
ncbi:MAG: thioesterase family protein [Acetobacteraceae bacterium]